MPDQKMKPAAAGVDAKAPAAAAAAPAAGLADPLTQGPTAYAEGSQVALAAGAEQTLAHEATHGVQPQGGATN